LHTKHAFSTPSRLHSSSSSAGGGGGGGTSLASSFALATTPATFAFFFWVGGRGFRVSVSFWRFWVAGCWFDFIFLLSKVFFCTAHFELNT
jgi:hypothetical protein